MSDAEKDPHVLVSARARSNPKLIELPSDRARWGWVVLLGEAKLVRPAGRFASRRVLDALMGDHRRYLADYLRVGLLHIAPIPPEVCDDCQACVARVGEIVVHNWSKHQERVSRTTAWRREHGLSSGHSSLNGETRGETTGKRTGDSGGDNGEPLAPVRASAGALQSQSLSSSSTEEGVSGEEPETPILAWLAEHGCFVRLGNGYHQRVILALERHTAAELLVALTRRHESGVPNGDINGLLFGAIDALDASKRPRDNGEAEREAVRSRRVDEQSRRRREAWFRETGEWDSAFGPPPVTA